MVKPYYENNGIIIYNCDNREVFPQIEEKSIDFVLTDLPFAKQTHEGARTLKKRDREVSPVDNILVDFSSISVEELYEYFDLIGSVAKKWVVSFLDWRHMHCLEDKEPLGLNFVRFGIWSKNSTGAPQYTGDRPATGWESIAFLHSDSYKGHMRWNGGGRDSVFNYNIPRGNDRIGDHKTAKPIGLISELIDLFSNPGDLVFDPFAGGMVVPYVCRLKGRRCISVEIEEKYCENVAKLLEKTPMLFTESEVYTQNRMDLE